VKIQHRGRRRTFALSASTRSAAAAEARALQESILSGNWEEVVRQYSGRQGRATPRTDVRYWKERLLLRNYPALPAARQREFSTRIEHAGIGWYLPLGSGDPDRAAFRALEVYRTIIEQGWNAAQEALPREVTLAFHWAADPLLWTYATFHTSPDGLQGCVLPPRSETQTTGILLVEPDPGLRKALAHWINQHDGCACVACSSAKDAHRQITAARPAFCVTNQELAGNLGLPNSAQLGTLPQGIPALSYGVHLDSEQLFALTPGGASGYVLKRTAPEHLLEPVWGVLKENAATEETLAWSAELYFQRLLQTNPAEKGTSRAAQLTQREQDVLNLMSKGYVDKEIARALGISTWTVHEHVKRIFEKLQVHSRTEAVLAYLQK
jgi:DNA-binding NarL/FixJ family response regulator